MFGSSSESSSSSNVDPNAPCDVIPTSAEKAAMNEAPASTSMLGPVAGPSPTDKGKGVASPTLAPAFGGSPAEQARVMQEHKETVERLAWCERFDAAQPQGQMSVHDEDYSRLVREWRLVQKGKEQVGRMERGEVIADFRDYVEDRQEMENADYVHEEEREVKKRERRFIFF